VLTREDIAAHARVLGVDTRMKVGTKSLLFGVHAFWLHPFIVAIAWTRLYSFPFDPRLWIAFFVHDLGYWGCSSIDGKDGKNHPDLGSKLMSPFGPEWVDFVKYHSRGAARRDNKPTSKLCLADKLAWTIEPCWLYIPRATLSGEITEYMQSAVGYFTFSTKREWYAELQRYALKVVQDLSSGGNGKWCSGADNAPC
jgi:hypothetical protein